MYGYYNEGLFRSEPSSDFLRNRLVKVMTQIASLKSDVFEANTIEEIERNYLEQARVSPIHLFPEQKEMDMDEVDIRIDVTRQPFYNPNFDDATIIVKGYKVTTDIPFDGDPELFNVTPSSYTLRRFEGQVVERNLRLTLEIKRDEVDDNGEVIARKIDDEIKSFTGMLTSLENDVNSYNAQLEEKIHNAVSSRFNELNKLRTLKTALKIPMKASSSPNPLNRITMHDSRITPLAAKSNGETGYYIAQKDYEDILDVIRSMGTSMETNRAAERQDEEGLRDILLAGLSSSIKGGNAGGELFRKSGKTDVSIIFDNKAAFVAECKLWKGRQYINEGINQLLGYITWRDVKVSLVIFNKEAKDFSRIQKQIPNIFQSRDDYVRDDGKQPNGEWRFVLQKPDDKDRHIAIHVFIFDVREKDSPNP